MLKVLSVKLEELKNDLLKKHIFGEVTAYTYVIECQKRELSQVYFLLIVNLQYKMYKSDDYDKIDYAIFLKKPAKLAFFY